MIELTNLTFQYPDSAQPALKAVNALIPPGTLTLVTGASGSGKSTLLRCLNGLVPHFSGGQISGSISVFGADPIAAGPQRMSLTVGFVFQEPEAQFVFDVVEDEIVFALENAGIPRAEMQVRVDEVCRHLNLEPLRSRQVQTLSGGEKQRVAIAGALASRPQLLVLDEPTSQLDPASADDVLQYLVKLKQEIGLTILVAEHRLERLLPYTDLMIHLPDDQEVLFCSPQAILPLMAQVPPIITLARTLNLTPLPLSPEAFPTADLGQTLIHNQPPKPLASSEQPSAFSVSQLSTTLGDKNILKDVSLEIRQGEILTLSGPNGAGKTTLLRSILGLTPSEGDRRLYGQQLTGPSLAEIIQHIAYLPQNPNDLLFAETVLDELKITLKNHNSTKDDTQLLAFLGRFNLADKASCYPRDLSVGERQRTALAAITVHDPGIILLDEPTRGLDYHNKHALANLLQAWRDEGKAILVVTHDVEFAAHLSDRAVLLEQGKVFFTGSPRIAFHDFPAYQTQTARIFPASGWITPEEAAFTPKSIR